MNLEEVKWLIHFLNLVVIGILILVNGFLSYAEAALISSKRSYLKTLVQTYGDKRAEIALKLLERPSSFLSTIQVGITLIGIITGALGGITISSRISGLFYQIPYIGKAANLIAFGLVVGSITLLTILIGELLPKRLALIAPEKGAKIVAPIIYQIEQLCAPVVEFLSMCIEKTIQIFGVETRRVPMMGRDEIRYILKEAVEAGVLPTIEFEMADRILALESLRVKDIMTTRPRIIWLSVDESHQQLWHKIVVSGHSRFPVYRGNRDNIVGVVSVKAIYANLAQGLPVNISDLAEKPLVVSEDINLLRLMETFRRHRTRFALVADNVGNLVGLVTLTDVMEAITGTFPDETEKSKPRIIKKEEGTWLADGLVEMRLICEVLPQFQLPDHEWKDSTQTLAGFLLERLGRVPNEGEIWRENGYVFEVLDMDGYRINKVFIMKEKDKEK